MTQIAKAYDHKEFEKDIYDRWEKAGYFKPEINPAGEPYTIIMPPPNANGSLHVGHALFVTLEDIMIRFARLNGKAALWLPGADHAGFETQTVFEKELEKEGKSRFQFERDELYKMTLDFTLKNKSHMEDQLRRLGASCDWEREKFTLDPDIIKIVYSTFQKLYDDGLAYRANRLVNWCPKHQTSLSELEVNYIEREDVLYEIQYGPIMVATTRPETLFGDVAVAVNSKDPRYSDLIGQEVPLPLTNRKIKIIADDAVDLKFGTGAVKITPAHDPVDFEIGTRHDLPLIQVIDERGKITNNLDAGIIPEILTKIEGKKAAEARLIVVEELEKAGVLVSMKKYEHSVGTCYRCNSIIEPLPKEQWYIAVNKKGAKSGKNLAADALVAVKDGRVKFVTKRFEKLYIDWLENIRDWNVSRQIVWGIRLPVYYRKTGVIPAQAGIQILDPRVKPEDDSRDVHVGTEPPADAENWIQDTDVFDTWFSSGQWPFAALKAQGTRDFEKFYPTSVMETGYDIIFFWVARMVMLGLYVTDEVPFENVYMHGIVRDKNNQKMSKSKGNVINPLDVADIYGTDAVRTALVFGTSAGADSSISEEKIRGMRNFSNKIWNASRFVMLQASEGDLKLGETGEFRVENLIIDDNLLTDADKEMLKAHETVKKSVTDKLNTYKFSQAGEELYEYFWHQFCDKYIESAKEQLLIADRQPPTADNTKKILIKILSESLIMLHPFVPFVTEAVWLELNNIVKIKDWPESIMIAHWPSNSNE